MERLWNAEKMIKMTKKFNTEYSSWYSKSISETRLKMEWKSTYNHYFCKIGVHEQNPNFRIEIHQKYVRNKK